MERLFPARLKFWFTDQDELVTADDKIFICGSWPRHGVLFHWVNGNDSVNSRNMKTNNKLIIGGVLSAALLTLNVSGCASEKPEQAQLQSQAKISKQQAQTIALTKAPGGTIKEADLEKEHGKLIWSFDIAVPNSRNITEVAVDAINGSVVSVDRETPEQQAEEKD